MKKIVLIVAAVLIVSIGIMSIWIVQCTKGFDAYMEEIKISDVDLSTVRDGVYLGIADSGVIYVEAQVIIKEHRIDSIKLLKHRNGQGSEAESIVDDIMKEQRIAVDTVSGATLSSLMIQDAIQKALTTGELLEE